MWNREKSLRHEAMVAKSVLDDNSHWLKLRQSYSISFNLSNVGEIFWGEIRKNRIQVKKRKRQFLCCARLLRKAGAWNREVSRPNRATTAKKRTKRRDARARAFFQFCLPSNLVLRVLSNPPYGAREGGQERTVGTRLFTFAGVMVTWRHTSLYCTHFRHSINRYLQEQESFIVCPLSIQHSKIHHSTTQHSVI